MIEVALNKIVIDEKRPDQLVILKEKNGKRILPIVIGLNEASAIKLKISGFEPPRPLTHDLLYNTICQLDAKLEKIIIDKLHQNTFYAKLVLKQDGKTKVVDARPSDSIALAVRSNAPIFVEEEVLEKSNLLNQTDA